MHFLALLVFKSKVINLSQVTVVKGHWLAETAVGASRNNLAKMFKLDRLGRRVVFESLVFETCLDVPSVVGLVLFGGSCNFILI